MVISAAHLSPVLALLFGVLILVLPRILNYLVAIYLILSGLLGLGFLVVPARAAATVATRATAFDPLHQPIAFSLVHCHHHTPSDRQRMANEWTEERLTTQTQAIGTVRALDLTANN